MKNAIGKYYAVYTGDIPRAHACCVNDETVRQVVRDFLKDRLKQSGMTQAQLGKLIDLEQPEVSQILSGDRGRFQIWEAVVQFGLKGPGIGEVFAQLANRLQAAQHKEDAERLAATLSGRQSTVVIKSEEQKKGAVTSPPKPAQQEQPKKKPR